jgi:hypothetical protein
MNRPRDPKGRYIKSKSDLSTKVHFDLYGGRNIPLINSTERYRKTGASSTQRAKVVYEETKTGSTIEQKIKASVIVEQEARPLEPSAEPKNTTFYFTPPPGDPNFEDIIDPEQVNIFFGSSTNVIISQINIETLAPIISTGSIRVPDTQNSRKNFPSEGYLVLFKDKTT